jgi:flagellar hook-length control protein FliK
MMQSGDMKNALQSALASANSLLTLTQGNGKQGASSGSGSSTNNVTANNQPVVPVPTNTTPSTPGSDFAKLVNAPAQTPADQVLVQIKNAAANGLSQIKIQLQPEDLGKVTVQLVTTPDGKTGVTVTADSRQTLSMLQSEARSLESALRDIGVKTNSGGMSFNLSSQQGQQQNQGKQGGYTKVAATTAIDDDSDYYGTATAIYRLSAQSGLDIRV